MQLQVIHGSLGSGWRHRAVSDPRGSLATTSSPKQAQEPTTNSFHSPLPHPSLHHPPHSLKPPVLETVPCQYCTPGLGEVGVTPGVATCWPLGLEAPLHMELMATCAVAGTCPPWKPLAHLRVLSKGQYHFHKIWVLLLILLLNCNFP